MSEQGLEVLDATFQKTHEWIAARAEISHLAGNSLPCPNKSYARLRRAIPSLVNKPSRGPLRCFDLRTTQA